eukprot:6762718-Pyramimonas_sp.AAC.1
MAKLLEQVRLHGLPDAFSRSTQQRARQSLAFQSTSFGPLLQKTEVPIDDNGGSVDIWVQHPLGFLEAACAESDSFRTFLQSVLNESSNKISILIYSDEVTPGNPLSDNNKRRIQAIYWSVAEFGWPALAHEEFWFAAAGIRSKVVDSLPGGMGEAFKHVLKSFFGLPSKPDLRHGVAMQIPGENSPRIVFGALALMLQDERAHKFSTHAKGAGAHKICAMCANC